MKIVESKTESRYFVATGAKFCRKIGEQGKGRTLTRSLSESH
uniref:Uncharacterized protein n=1 Tax=Rhizophora mucronata TaxID=61149 RepID=A0A2P2NSD0_RHIMU